jgi:hypothetical protein
MTRNHFRLFVLFSVGLSLMPSIVAACHRTLGYGCVPGSLYRLAVWYLGVNPFVQQWSLTYISLYSVDVTSSLETCEICSGEPTFWTVPGSITSPPPSALGHVPHRLSSRLQAGRIWMRPILLTSAEQSIASRYIASGSLDPYRRLKVPNARDVNDGIRYCRHRLQLERHAK